MSPAQRAKGWWHSLEPGHRALVTLVGVLTMGVTLGGWRIHTLPARMDAAERRQIVSDSIRDAQNRQLSRALDYIICRLDSPESRACETLRRPPSREFMP